MGDVKVHELLLSCKLQPVTNIMILKQIQYVAVPGSDNGHLCTVMYGKLMLTLQLLV